MTITRSITQKLIDLGALALRLSRVERITFHEDGTRPETDSDHTVMLALIAPAFAERFLPDLDLGLIMQMAVVHDLVEAYAGDTPTLSITEQGQVEKHEREVRAFLRIRDEFWDSFPWVAQMIERYEDQIEPEARYIRALDKLLPKITHILNHGRTFSTVHGHMTQEQLVARYARQHNELMAYASNFPPLFELREHLIAMVFESVSWEVTV